MEFAFGADRTAFDMLYEFWDLTEGAVVIWLEPGIKLIENFSVQQIHSFCQQTFCPPCSENAWNT